MKVLVTGASGFCGSHLISRLEREPGVEIAGLDRGAASGSPCLAQYFQADMCDRAAIESIVESFAPDRVFHLAGVSATSSSPDSIYEANVTGTVYLLETLVQRAPGCKVLLAGSAAEYGPVFPECLPVTENTPCRPMGAYGISKYAATLIGIDHFNKYGLKVAIARPSNIIGPGVPKTLVVGALLDRAQKALAFPDPEVKVGDYDSERDFVDVRDVVDALHPLDPGRTMGADLQYLVRPATLDSVYRGSAFRQFVTSDSNCPRFLFCASFFDQEVLLQL